MAVLRPVSPYLLLGNSHGHKLYGNCTIVTGIAITNLIENLPKNT